MASSADPADSVSPAAEAVLSRVNGTYVAVRIALGSLKCLGSFVSKAAAVAALATQPGVTQVDGCIKEGAYRLSPFVHSCAASFMAASRFADPPVERTRSIASTPPLRTLSFDTSQENSSSSCRLDAASTPDCTVADAPRSSESFLSCSSDDSQHVFLSCIAAAAVDSHETPPGIVGPCHAEVGGSDAASSVGYSQCDRQNAKLVAFTDLLDCVNALCTYDGGGSVDPTLAAAPADEMSSSAGQPPSALLCSGAAPCDVDDLTLETSGSDIPSSGPLVFDPTSAAEACFSMALAEVAENENVMSTVANSSLRSLASSLEDETTSVGTTLADRAAETILIILLSVRNTMPTLLCRRTGPLSTVRLVRCIRACADRAARCVAKVFLALSLESALHTYHAALLPARSAFR